MKTFILVVAVSIVGGFVGGEVMNSGFSATGALIGGVSFGLGAFFNDPALERICNQFHMFMSTLDDDGYGSYDRVTNSVMIGVT